MSYYQYQLEVNGAKGPITSEYPGEQWTRISQTHEQRGGKATFYRRLITDHDILPLLTGRSGYIKLPNDTICPWEILAEFDNEQNPAIIIG